MNKLNSIVISLFRRWRGYARTEATEFELIVASVFAHAEVVAALLEARPLVTPPSHGPSYHP